MIDEDGNLDLDEDEVQNAEDGEEGWDVDDIAIPPELEAVARGAVISSDDNGFSVPQRGQPPTFYWPNNSPLLADHVIAGSFNTAAQLFNRQLGVVNLKPFKQLFMLFYSRFGYIKNLIDLYFENLFFSSKLSHETLPLSTPNFVYPTRNWQEANVRTSLPAISVKLSDLAEKLQGCYQLTTAGKFAEAIVKFRQIMYNIPFLVVNSKQEVLNI